MIGASIRKSSRSFVESVRLILKVGANLPVPWPWPWSVSWSEPTPWDTVRVARHPARPQTRDYIGMITRDFAELSDSFVIDRVAIRSRLGSDPGTVLYHVRQLVAAGLLAPAEVRTGPSGALEKPYRSTGVTWWLDGPLNDEPPEVRYAPVEAFQQELSEAGPASVATFERFFLHLSDDEVDELDLRILAVLDEYIATDDDRRGLPGRRVHGGVFALHLLAEPPEPPSPPSPPTDR